MSAITSPLGLSEVLKYSFKWDKNSNYWQLRPLVRCVCKHQNPFNLFSHSKGAPCASLTRLAHSATSTMPQQPSPTISLHCHSYNGTLRSYTPTTNGSSATYNAVRACSPHIAYSQRVGPAASQPAPTYARCTASSIRNPTSAFLALSCRAVNVTPTHSQPTGALPLQDEFRWIYVSSWKLYCSEAIFENVAHSQHQEFSIICIIQGFITSLLAIVKPYQKFSGCVLWAGRLIARPLDI